MGDYYWTLHREIPDTSHKMKIYAGRRKRQYKAIE
jgi:hypothetical protein